MIQGAGRITVDPGLKHSFLRMLSMNDGNMRDIGGVYFASQAIGAISREYPLILSFNPELNAVILHVGRENVHIFVDAKEIVAEAGRMGVGGVQIPKGTNNGLIGRFLHAVMTKDRRTVHDSTFETFPLLRLQQELDAMEGKESRRAALASGTYRLGKALQSGDVDEQTRCCRDLIKADPEDSGNYRLTLFHCYLQLMERSVRQDLQNDTREYLSLFGELSRVLAKHPKGRLTLEAFLERSLATYASEPLRGQAKKVVEEALGIVTPGNPLEQIPKLGAQADSAYAAGRLEEARTLYRQIFDIAPTLVQAVVMYTKTLIRIAAANGLPGVPLEQSLQADLRLAASKMQAVAQQSLNELRLKTIPALPAYVMEQVKPFFDSIPQEDQAIVAGDQAILTAITQNPETHTFSLADLIAASSRAPKPVSSTLFIGMRVILERNLRLVRVQDRVIAGLVTDKNHIPERLETIHTRKQTEIDVARAELTRRKEAAKANMAKVNQPLAEADQNDPEVAKIKALFREIGKL